MLHAIFLAMLRRMVQRVSFSITTVLLSFSFGNIARDVVGNIAHNVPACVTVYYYPIILFSNAARDILGNVAQNGVACFLPYYDSTPIILLR